jgi:hypothetical protein
MHTFTSRKGLPSRLLNLLLAIEKAHFNGEDSVC